jgi:3-deoxy-manno-octulosonate cytidylyltransferase (CMP-KDO synthetase)
MRQNFSPRVVVIIPARYQSSRFRGKPLIDLCGKSMIQRVWQICCQAVLPEDVYVATDNVQIENHCGSLGMNVLMTPETCMTGTDRVFEASRQVQSDVFINVQGDEPLLDPQDISRVIEESVKYPQRIINAMCPIDDEREYINSSVPKVVVRPDGRLLYMSRGAIPTNKALKFSRAYKQVCIYAFPRESLAAFAKVKEKTPLEAIEDIEILRFLELGFDVNMVEVSSASVAIDVLEDAERVRGILRETA